MAYVITQNCCKDASCVPVCPVDCIRPIGGAGQITGTEMLYIEPETCIDCGACLDVCPVGAIHYEDELPERLERYAAINAAYFERHPLEGETAPKPPKRGDVPRGELRVAIVGAGPAACYAASELIGIDGVEVELFERLPTPYGLIRAGVAPDHQHTKSVVDIFNSAFGSERMGVHLNVEIGRDVTHDVLAAHHHAVIYAVGASHSRALGVPGEELPGSYAASDFVGWYNGHPDHAARTFDLSARRAFIVGNGNVALDVARVLAMRACDLNATDVAQHALDTLQDSQIDEVVILGRRGVRHAAFSAGEFLALGHLDGVDVVIEGDADLDASPEDDAETALKLEIAREYQTRSATQGDKRIVFRFKTSPVEFVGEDRVEGLLVTQPDGGDWGPAPGRSTTGTESIHTALVLRSIGYRGCAIEGLPYDEAAGTIPNLGGRVVDAANTPIPGVYVTGWIKRGPRGVIGSNRTCAEETVAALLADFDDGVLNHAVGDREALTAALMADGAEPVPWKGWQAIDSSEREHGAAESRPRVKLVDMEAMLAAARSTSQT